MPIAVLALSLAAFCIGTTEFIVSGILLHVSEDLGISIPMAGLLVTGYAAGVAVGGPLLGLLLTRFPLKNSILGVMVIFAIGQVLCALAPNYELLLGARLISACGHGVFFGVASVAVTQLVTPEKRGSMLSLLVGGITIANILGLPGGTVIGNAFGWRAPFVIIAVMAVISVVAVFFALPARTAGEDEADAPLRLQAKQLLRQEVFLTYLGIAIIMVGQIAFATFQVAILTEITGIDPISTVPYFLLLGGAGAVIGIWLGGRLANRFQRPAILGILCGQVLAFALMLPALHYPPAAAIMLFVSSLLGFGFSTPVQLRVLSAAKDAPRLASTLVSTSYNTGIAAGAFLGAVLLNYGLGYELLPTAGIVCSALALVVFLVSFRLERQSLARATA